MEGQGQGQGQASEDVRSSERYRPTAHPPLSESGAHRPATSHDQAGSSKKAKYPMRKVPDHLLTEVFDDLDSDEDISDDEDITVEELESRIRCTSMLIAQWRKMNQQTDGKMEAQSTEQSRRKKMSRAHGKVLDNMLLLMDSGGAQGFVYGIIPEKGRPVTGSSDNLRGWWKEKVKFEHNGPVAVETFRHKKDPKSGTNAPVPVPQLLMGFRDSTLGSLLSTLMQQCKPPQRRFPLDRRIQPPWWPTMEEDWWPQLGLSSDQGPVPYRKPHDLKKAWKVGVLIAAIRNIAPNFNHIQKTVQKSSCLQGKMSERERSLWCFALGEEIKWYTEQHPDAPQPALDNEPPSSTSSSGKYDVDVVEDGFDAGVGVEDDGVVDAGGTENDGPIGSPANDNKLHQGSQERVVAEEELLLQQDSQEREVTEEELQQILSRNNSAWQNPLQSVMFVEQINQNSLQQGLNVEDPSPVQQQPTVDLNALLQTPNVGPNYLLPVTSVDQNGLQQLALSPNALLQTPNVGPKCLLPMPGMELDLLQHPTNSDRYSLLQNPIVDANPSYDHAGQGTTAYFPTQITASEQAFKHQPGGFDGDFIYDSPFNFTDLGGLLISKDGPPWFF